LLERWIVYSIEALLMGINVYFIFRNLLGQVIFAAAAIISLIFFVFGLMKEHEPKISSRSWEDSWNL